MITQSPLVSIIIPTFNRAHLIVETLDSVLAQTYENWECIIVDDGSSDNTEQLIAEFIKKEPRISYFKKPKNLPKGPSSARNYGLTKSQGEYINWFDSDDLMHPDKLKIDLEHITLGDYDFTISQSKFFNEKGEIQKDYWNDSLWSEDPINDFIIKKIGWGVNSPLWKRKSLEKNQHMFNEKLMTSNDYFYHIQALKYGLTPVVINEVLVNSRVHPQRLYEFEFKSKSKILVNIYLLEHKKELKLNAVTLNYLKNQYFNQFIKLLKQKQLRIAFYCLNKTKLHNYTFYQKYIFLKNLFIGAFYKLSGYGYGYLKYKFIKNRTDIKD